MIHWAWLIVALQVGVIFGILAVSLCRISAERCDSDQCSSGCGTQPEPQ